MSDSFPKAASWRFPPTVGVVCENSTCMYSCGTTNEYRLDDLRSFVEGNPDDFDTLGKCSINEEKTSAFGRSSADEVSLIQGGFPSAVREGYSLGAAPLGDAVRLSESLRESFLQRNFPQEEHESDVEDDTTVAPTIGGDAGFAFMDYGLWVATIASLAAGMLFAVVGALFAVINTATTPVEAITGVPGLYVWNTLAAVFNLVCVICWAVQFHTRLTKNVLVRDSLNGWTTEGQEIFGYSYWLVVVAIVVHIANCVIIGVGTYEPRRKEVVHAPHVNKQDNNILLY